MASLDRAKDLTVFDAVASTGSFSAAGRQLDLTPSGVSRTIDRIEARLGTRLLLRSTRALSLTAEGRTYLGGARRILSDLDEVERAIADQGAPRGRVRLSAAVAHGRVCIVPLLKAFVRAHPLIVVDVNLSDAKVDIAQGQADVAIRSGPLPDSLLMARRLGDNGRTIVASPDYLAEWGTPLVPGDLARHNCLNFNFRRAEPVWPFRIGGENVTMAVHGSIEANSGETLLQLALDGVGMARVGNFGIGRAIAEGRLVPLLEPYNPGDREVFQAVFVGGANMPTRIRLFVDYLAENYRVV
ncbi:MAG: putative transcriptional regulatory protein LysR family [Sphingomonas bacterium]|uniref:LysR family transcriptional regulator n=1 Tax=Sphingomonas bacterium TaxID=1895847 RepID=UPI00260D4BC2|nr:LysR family transcriptional regulator [Sphingomonas bacterium]MDB5709941.1 putative transcriptional regulatory protein LysR family [Sphingomonas bacterium]